MKFHELEEGKKYRHTNSGYTEKGIYFLKLGLLCSEKETVYDHEGISGFTMRSISHWTFEEVIEYVTFEEAMKKVVTQKNRQARFKGKDYKIDFYGVLRSRDKGVWAVARFEYKMLEPKWQLV